MFVQYVNLYNKLFLGYIKSSFLLIFIYLSILIFLIKALCVRVRLCGDSLAITLPRQIARLHDIEKGNTMEISPIGSGEFKIKKID